MYRILVGHPRYMAKDIIMYVSDLDEAVQIVEGCTKRGIFVVMEPYTIETVTIKEAGERILELTGVDIWNQQAEDC